MLAVFFVTLAFCAPVIFLAWYLRLTETVAAFKTVGCLTLTLILGLASWVTFFSIGHEVLQTRFAIHQHGLTEITYPIFIDREGKFVAFVDIESFSVSRSRRTCVTMLHNRDTPIWWHSRDPKAILAAADALRKNGIPETD